MKKITIISDTHSFIDKKIYNLISDCDEIWHAGDFGFSDQIKKFINSWCWKDRCWCSCC